MKSELYSLICLHDPMETDVILWKYMDFTKFVSILENSALFFPRADKLGDPFEGSVPKNNISSRPIWHPDLTEKDTIMYGFVIQQIPRFTLINCWHRSNHESEGMWKLYASVDGGIAIRTNLINLIESFKTNEHIHVGQVKYVDYERDSIPEDNSLFPYLYKRKSFEHEREVRAIIQKLPLGIRETELKDGIRNMSTEKINQWLDFCENGIHYDIDINHLIQEVVIAHFAPEWLLDLVTQVAKRYGLKSPINRSYLADSPTW